MPPAARNAKVKGNVLVVFCISFESPAAFACAMRCLFSISMRRASSMAALSFSKVRKLPSFVANVSCFVSMAFAVMHTK